MTRAITFGRAPAGETHIHVDDEYCLPRHCRVVDLGGSRFLVEDLGSTNGTWLVTSKGLKLPVRGPTTMPRNARVHIGRTTLPWEAR